MNIEKDAFFLNKGVCAECKLEQLLFSKNKLVSGLLDVARGCCHYPALSNTIKLEECCSHYFFRGQVLNNFCADGNVEVMDRIRDVVA